MKVPHPEVEMSEYPCEYKVAAPDLGQHDDEVLKEVGFSEKQIAKLRECGSIN